jgi:UDP-N-acetylglucosamine--N-acetylmuramyl-(pentapeptide) pyrophosphoryl-undecaprenol N-acetylglucosamine transferase
MFVAGGTGGHINPAIAVAKEVKRLDPSSEILFVGTEGRMETKIVPDAGFEIKTVRMNGFSRNLTFAGIIENIKTVILTVKAYIDAKKILEEFRPDVVVGFGGYVTGPVLKMAVKMGIKTAIHEQNAFPGVANKALAKEVDKVMLTSADAEQHMKCKNPPIVTGLPVRREILKTDRDYARASMGLQNDDILVLSMGGSLGADAINKAVVEMLDTLKDEKNICFLHSTGKYGKWVEDKLREMNIEFGGGTNIHIREYIDNMDVCLPACDIVISRAGASSISEIQALNKPSILIPSPNVAENHQFHNAMALVKNEGAVLIEEKDLDGKYLAQKVMELKNDRIKLYNISKNAGKDAKINALSEICRIITAL